MNDDSPRTAPGRARFPRAMTIAAAAVGAIVVLGVGMSGVTQASWNATTTVSPGTIATGTADLTVTEVSDAAWSNLLPGESVRQSFVVTNSGTASLQVTGSTTSTAAGFEVRIAAGDCPGTPLTAEAGSPAAFGTLEPGETSTGCLEVRLGFDAQPGAQSGVQVRLDGAQQ